MTAEPLCSSLLAKIDEQVERTVHLLGLIPPDRRHWTPAYPGGWPAETLIAHLLECMAGFCAVLVAVEPERLAHFGALRTLRDGGAVERIEVYRRHIDEGFALLTDAALSRSIPTVFVPKGETVLTLLLGNLEHLINHKHQLFTYVKEMGLDARTADLYRLRGV